MALTTSHAAEQKELFSVEVLSTGTPATVIASGLTDFLDAVDRAMEWLARDGEERDEEPSVVVYSTIDDVRRQVWGHPESACAHPRPDHRLVEVFGFDPVNWQAPGDTASRMRIRVQATPAPPTPSLAVLAAAASVPEVATPAPAAVDGAWLGLRAELRRVWADRFARGLLLAGVVSL